MKPILALAAAALAVPLAAQTTAPESITLYERPAFLGRSVTITTATPDLATLGFAKRAQSARVSGSWTACPDVQYRGACRPLAGDQPALALSGFSKTIASLRPASAAAATTATATSTAAAVNVADLDVDAGVEGQDTAYFARPAFERVEVSAGANDRTAGDAFCKAAGYTSSLHASRARAQTSNLIDVTAGTRGRGFPLRDVLCRK